MQQGINKVLWYCRVKVIPCLGPRILACTAQQRTRCSQQGMIETRANKKTASVFRDLENDTKELMDVDNDNGESSGVPSSNASPEKQTASD